MNKTEAAEIIAIGIRVFYRNHRTPAQYNALLTMGEAARTAIAERIGEDRYAPQGSPKYKAAVLRPSDRTVIAQLRKLGEL